MRKIFVAASLSFVIAMKSHGMAERTKIIMGTYATIRLNEAHARFANPAFEVIHDLDRILSTYKSDSEVSRLNRLGQLKHPSRDLRALLKRSLALSAETQGYFDVTVGSLVHDIYGFQRLSETEARELPSPNINLSHLQDSLDRTGAEFIAVDDSTIRFKKSGMKLDFGGIGKGYAVDQTAARLRAFGVNSGQIALSGDIRCLDICSVDISDPMAPDSGPLARLKTRKPDTAITTSGGYRRFLGDPGTNHLLNPKTGRSQNEFLGVTLIGIGDNTRLDALATSVSVMPNDTAMRFLNAKNDLAWIVIRKDGTRLTSANITHFATLVFLPSRSDFPADHDRDRDRDRDRMIDKKTRPSAPKIENSKPINANSFK